MDGNNHDHDEHSLLNFVRRLLPHPRTSSAPSAGAEHPPSEASEVAHTISAPMPPVASLPLETTISGAPTGSTTASTPATASSAPLQSLQNLSTSASAAPITAPAPDITAPQADSVRDVEMTPVEDAGPSSASSSSRPASSSETRSTRRARVEDDGEEEDYWRESNRQRMHSPTPHEDNDHHHYMPIPEDHPVPESTRGGAAASQGNAGASTEQPQHPPQGPPPPYGSLFLTLDFIPIPFGNTPGNAQPSQPQDAPHPLNASQPPNAPQPGPQRPGQDGHPIFNFLMNLPPVGAGPGPQPGAPGNDGGNAPGNAGFTPSSFTIPFTIPFPFGLDRLEERDDPERAQKLVDGLEEVPVGLIKRMQQVGGPGTDPGEVPTCAVCWESLLEPEGGGFEGNAELAKAEAAQAARDDAASQQGAESPMDVDGALSSSGESSEIASGSSPAPESSGDDEQPKIVVLPCSHAFHATCLLPWFSKPGRTTCPSCRFDIDPDSLTYRPRPLRARGPPPDPQGGAAPTPQAQAHPAFGIHIPPVAVPQAAPASPVAAQNAAAAPEGAPPADADARPASAAGQAGQQPHQPLPPFMMFDIGMIIPMNPGRAAAGTAPPASGAQAPNPAGPTGHGIPPLPPRTDNHGFRLEDSVLQEVVRQTFERVFGGPIPPVAPQAPPTAPGENGTHAARQPEWFVHPGPLPGFPPMTPLNFQAPQGVPRHQSGPRRPAEKRQWTPPPAPGPTLRQVVERKEREMGYRCSDISCGLGPSDDDPVSSIDLSSLRQISIRPLNADPSGKDSVCEHKFHPACLVSAERVAGWGREVKTGEPAGDSEQVEVSCPVCRAIGVISRLDWEEGACALA
ncbi:hypothetical protein K466DRAFT_543309 [Polyporus arcularius HHB13444]|uniref:RING-type domain-containing protein n=1 Tax=Polyporus arcularius HHB13444 TaxID=1314778 RepID=A0A5C3PLT5_9APHY|nr:hypothetical protein K466DRAFT_543309 [Polyporus arcularius HHB13444]